MNNGIPVQDWVVDDVVKWLSEHQLRPLISRFESLGITGEHLLTMDESVMKNDLRIINPGERAALNGALMNIRTVDAHRTFTMPVRSRSTSFERTSNDRLNTMPQQRHKVAAPKSAEIMIAPAPKLLDDVCRHSGWIRKMGGSYKSWKQRYMILRMGHLYYYENESAKGPKGHFPLHGYIAEGTNEIKRYPWVFKLRHHDPKMRTYYIGVAAKRELEQWVQHLNKEIQDMSSGLSNTFPKIKNSVVAAAAATVPSIQEDQLCEVDEDDQALYDEVAGEDEDCSDDETPYEKMQQEQYYDSIQQESPDEEEEEEYEEIKDDQFVPPRPSPIPPRPSLSPSHSPGPSSVPPLTSPRPHYPPTMPRQSRVDVPVIPPRPMGSSLPRGMEAELEPESEENPYLSIVGQPSAGLLGSTTGCTEPGQNNHEEDDDPNLDETEEENPYYITLGSVGDVMPKHCVFDAMSREDAEGRLGRNHRVGNYLLRDGHHQGAVKVLSVWAGQKCRHYKLYKEEKGFCLTHGDGFPTIPMLLQHYKVNERLPKSDYNLGEPYHPLDH